MLTDSLRPTTEQKHGLTSTCLIVDFASANPQTLEGLPEPTTKPEPEYQPTHHQEHQTECKGITQSPIQFRHVEGRFVAVEVHPINAGDERGRNEDGRDDRQHFQNFVHPSAFAAEMKIHQVRTKLMIRFNQVNDAHRVVVAVAQIERGFLRPNRTAIANERVERVAQRPDRPAQSPNVTFQLVDARRKLIVVLSQNFVFKAVQSFSDNVEDREVAINDRVDKGISQVVSRFFANLADAPLMRSRTGLRQSPPTFS